MKTILLALSFTSALGASAGELPAVPLFRHGIIADNVGAANLVPADITGDGRPEIISCSNGAPFALEHRAGEYEQLWYGPSVGCNAVTAGDVDGDGATDVIVATPTHLFIFDPRGLGAAWASVPLPASGYDVAFGNVDFDAAPEIVVASASVTYVFDPATLELQWTASGYGGTAVAIADVDGDARNEIVLGGGSVLDGGNEVLKWGYLGGFPALAVGNLDADAKAEIVFAASYSSVTVLQGDTMTTSTVTGFPDGIQQLTVADANGNGVNEVIAGNDQWGVISGRSAADSTLVWSIGNPEHGCMAVAVGDVDGDGVNEVLWGAGWSSSGEDALFVGDPISQTIQWSSIDLDGPFGIAGGDIDGDGRAELVAVTGGSRSGYDGPVLGIFDAVTGATQRELELGYWDGTGKVVLAQLDADPAKEIVIGLYYGMVVYDGVTAEVEWTSPGALSGMVVANVDGDATDEIISRSDDKLIVLHGISNIVQSSRIFAGYVLGAGDVNGDGLAEVLAATSTTLHLMSGTLTTLEDTPLQSALAAAATPASGGRIAVIGEWDRRIFVFDATLTQQWACDSPTNNEDYTALAFGNIGGQTRLLTGDSTGMLRSMPLDGNSCPEADTRNLGKPVNSLLTTDVTGDGRADLLFGSSNAAEVTLIGRQDEIRGDVNGDAVIASNDVDQLVDYLFGAAVGLSPTGDANADERLSPEDVFTLIHHEFGGGSLPE